MFSQIVTYFSIAMLLFAVVVVGYFILMDYVRIWTDGKYGLLIRRRIQQGENNRDAAIKMLQEDIRGAKNFFYIYTNTARKDVYAYIVEELKIAAINRKVDVKIVMNEKFYEEGHPFFNVSGLEVRRIENPIEPHFRLTDWYVYEEEAHLPNDDKRNYTRYWGDSEKVKHFKNEFSKSYQKNNSH